VGIGTGLDAVAKKVPPLPWTEPQPSSM